MALAHELSQDVVTPSLDLFSIPGTNTSILQSNYVQLNPTSSITDNSTIEFYIPGTGLDYLDLNNTTLHTRVKIVKADGTALDADEPVGLINYPAASLFSQVDVVLGDKLITQSANTYGYRAYIEALLHYDKSTIETALSPGLFILDTPGHHDAQTTHNGTNLGMRGRQAYTALSMEVDLISPLHVDFFLQEKLLLNGVDVRVRLTRAKNEFCLMRHGGDEFKVVILAASLYVKKVTPAPHIALAHAQALLQSNARYAYDRTEIKCFTLARGSRSISLENLFLGRQPRALALGLVENGSFIGSLAKNPYRFQHFNLNHLSLHKDGMQIPSTPLTPRFDIPGGGGIAREYFQIISATNRHLKNQALAFDRKDFQQGYALYVFNLAPDDDTAGCMSLVKHGNLRLDMTFSHALPETVTLIAYASYDAIIEISSRREVLMDI